jgi:hypothetical protein
MICSLARLDEKQLEAVRKLEEKLGKVFLAFACADIDTDEMSEEQLSELKKTEDELCLSLLAVKK